MREPSLESPERSGARGVMLLAAAAQFNAGLRVLSVSLLLGVLAAPTLGADEIRRWRDAGGRLHVEIIGDGTPVDPDVQGMPLLSTTELSEDEKFSIATSRSRRQIARGVERLSADLSQLESDIARVEAEAFVVYSPPTARSPKEAQFLLDTQRNAFLAAQRFRQEQDEQLRRLRRERVARLRELLELWERFDGLRTAVRERYGKPPEWWRDEIDCPACRTATEARAAIEAPEDAEPAGDELGSPAPRSGLEKRPVPRSAG